MLKETDDILFIASRGSLISSRRFPDTTIAPDRVRVIDFSKLIVKSLSSQAQFTADRGIVEAFEVNEGAQSRLSRLRE
jgi:hypothetical protein